MAKLLVDYRKICSSAEQCALELISSSHLPVLNNFRDASAHKVYTALCSLQNCYGSKVNVERCLSLVLLTDYITCACSSSGLHDSFIKVSEKFICMMFQKLCIEWSVILNNKIFDFFEENDVRRMLRFLQNALNKLPSVCVCGDRLQSLINIGDILCQCSKKRSVPKDMDDCPKLRNILTTGPQNSAKDSNIENQSICTKKKANNTITKFAVPVKKKVVEVTKEKNSADQIVDLTKDSSPQKDTLATSLPSISPNVLIARENTERKQKKNAFDILMRRKVSAKPV